MAGSQSGKAVCAFGVRPLRLYRAAVLIQQRYFDPLGRLLAAVHRGRKILIRIHGAAHGSIVDHADVDLPDLPVRQGEILPEVFPAVIPGFKPVPEGVADGSGKVASVVRKQSADLIDPSPQSLQRIPSVLTRYSNGDLIIRDLLDSRHLDPGHGFFPFVIQAVVILIQKYGPRHLGGNHKADILLLLGLIIVQVQRLGVIGPALRRENGAVVPSFPGIPGKHKAVRHISGQIVECGTDTCDDPVSVLIRTCLILQPVFLTLHRNADRGHFRLIAGHDAVPVHVQPAGAGYLKSLHHADAAFDRHALGHADRIAFLHPSGALVRAGPAQSDIRALFVEDVAVRQGHKQPVRPGRQSRQPGKAFTVRYGSGHGSAAFVRRVHGNPGSAFLKGSELAVVVVVQKGHHKDRACSAFIRTDLRHFRRSRCDDRSRHDILNAGGHDPCGLCVLPGRDAFIFILSPVFVPVRRHSGVRCLIFAVVPFHRDRYGDASPADDFHGRRGMGQVPSLGCCFRANSDRQASGPVHSQGFFACSDSADLLSVDRHGKITGELFCAQRPVLQLFRSAEPDPDRHHVCACGAAGQHHYGQNGSNQTTTSNLSHDQGSLR